MTPNVFQGAFARRLGLSFPVAVSPSSVEVQGGDGCVSQNGLLSLCLSTLLLALRLKISC